LPSRDSPVTKSGFSLQGTPESSRGRNAKWCLPPPPLLDLFLVSSFFFLTAARFQGEHLNVMDSVVDDWNSGQCMSVRLSVLEKTQGSLSPGPIYQYRDALGRQVSSRARTAPSAVFTFAGRNSRPFDAPDMSLIPGPKYDMDPLVGKQVRSTYRTTSSVHFGTAERKDNSVRDASEQGAFQPIPKVQSRHSPAFSIAGAPWRHNNDIEAPCTPGPGGVELPSAMGRQIESQRTNVVTVKMQPQQSAENGSLSRVAKVEAPGPGSYNLTRSTLGSKSIRFGTAEQRPTIDRDAASTPSAASYSIKEDFLSTSKKSKGFKINPASKYAGRTRRPNTSDEFRGASAEDSLLAELRADLAALEQKRRRTDRETATKRVLSKEKSVLGGCFGSGPARASWGTGDPFSISEEPPPTPSPQEYDNNRIQKGVMMLSKTKGPGGIKFTNAVSRKSDLMEQPDPELLDPNKLKTALNLCRKSTEYNIKFSNVPRFDGRKTKKRVINGEIIEVVEKDTPGPMDYKMHPGLGKQVLSTKRNGIMPLMKSRVKEVEEYGAKVIGPMTYHVPSGRGARAGKKMAHDIKFGTSERMPEPKGAGVPGPNSYKPPPSAISLTQHESKYRSSRSITFGAR
jgi:hypothetical protein